MSDTSDFDNDTLVREAFMTFRATPLPPSTHTADEAQSTVRRRRRVRVAVTGIAVLLVAAVPVTAYALAAKPSGGPQPAHVPTATGSLNPSGTPNAITSSIPSETPTPGPSSSSTSHADAGPTAGTAPDRCHTDGLRGDFHQFQWPGQAGSESDAELGLTNIGGRTCVIYGYPGLQLIGADGQPRTTTVVRAKSQPSRSVTLTPGATAWALVVSRFTPLPDEENTNPLCGGQINQIKVIPPDETTQLTVNGHVGTVCSHGELTVTPFQATRPSDGPPPSGP